MNINPIQTVTNYHCKNPIFKSAYPVYHWVAETNGSYAVTITEELSKKLQSRLIRMLNNSRLKTQTAQIAEKVKKYISIFDASYKNNPITRSFYNKKGGFRETHFEPISYLVTGDDAVLLEETLGKPLGIIKSKSPLIKGKPQSAELTIAIEDYKNLGLNFVKTCAKKIRDERGINLGLHTKFEVIRTKNGKIKDFKLAAIKFCPEIGENNPFKRVGYYK